MEITGTQYTTIYGLHEIQKSGEHCHRGCLCGSGLWGITAHAGNGNLKRTVRIITDNCLIPDERGLESGDQIKP